jgi:conjugal transfer pilus assembly protein TraD
VFEHALKLLGIGAVVAFLGGFVLASTLRQRGLRWTWASLGLPSAYLMLRQPLIAVPIFLASLLACVLGAHWHHEDLDHGADFAEAARRRLGLVGMLRRRRRTQAVKDEGWASDGRLVIGRDEQGMPVSMPLGYTSGSHTLVVGATGSGKTVSEAWIACRLIEDGHGAIVIDPKGDEMLRDELKASAERRGAEFLEWTPEGPLAYNPYANGTDTEIADKALSGEEFTEPHYLRQAQRYLGHAVRVMHRAGVQVTPASLMAHLDPGELEVCARGLSEAEAEEAQSYLDSITDRQRRDLAGVRDRLSILAESDSRRWLDPARVDDVLDIQQAAKSRAVVYFRLDSDRRPLLAAMLAAAIVSDLITLVARMQAQPIPTVVMIDEFSAVAAEHVARLFGRARSAGISLILGTQELADLKSVGDGALREQTLGNVATVIAHRQNVPESAELIASLAGTKATWVTTQQTEQGLIGSHHAGKGTRRRGYEFEIHPTRVKQLHTGQAVVITPGSGSPTIAQVFHPSEAHAHADRKRGPRLSGSSLSRPLRSASRRTTTTRSTRRNT